MHVNTSAYYYIDPQINIITYSIRPGQVVKLSTSRRLAALLGAACHRGWCVCVFAFEWLGQKVKQFFGKSVVSEGFEGLKATSVRNTELFV